MHKNKNKPTFGNIVNENLSGKNDTNHLFVSPPSDDKVNELRHGKWD